MQAHICTVSTGSFFYTERKNINTGSFFHIMQSHYIQLKAQDDTSKWISHIHPQLLQHSWQEQQPAMGSDPRRDPAMDTETDPADKASLWLSGVGGHWKGVLWEYSASHCRCKSRLCRWASNDSVHIVLTWSSFICVFVLSYSFSCSLFQLHVICWTSPSMSLHVNRSDWRAPRLINACLFSMWKWAWGRMCFRDF